MKKYERSTKMERADSCRWQNVSDQITSQVRSEEHERHAMNDDDNEQTEHHRLMSTTGRGKMDEQKIPPK